MKAPESFLAEHSSLGVGPLSDSVNRHVAVVQVTEAGSAPWLA